MSNELTPMQTFEQKVKDRLVKDIGDLIPDEALKALVDKAMDNAFFEPQIVMEGTGYQQKQVSKPSVFEQTVKELLEPLLREQIKLWICDNEETVLKNIQQFLDRGVEHALMGALTSAVGMHFTNMKYNIENDLFNRLQR